MQQATEEQITKNLSILDKKLQSRYNPQITAPNTRELALSRPNVQDFEQKAGALIKRNESGNQGNIALQGPQLVYPVKEAQPNEPTLLNGHSLGIKLQDIMQLDGKQRIQHLQQLFQCIRDFKSRSDAELTSLNTAVKNQNQLWMQLELGTGIQSNMQLGSQNSGNDMISRFLEINRDSLNSAARYLSSQLTQADSVAAEILGYLTAQYEQVQLQKSVRDDLEKEVEALKSEIEHAKMQRERCMKRSSDLAQLSGEGLEDNELNYLIKQQNDLQTLHDELVEAIGQMASDLQQQLDAE